jgi:hypothetical protein
MAERKFTDAEKLAAYDNFGSARKAAEALGCSHQIILRAVHRRDADPAIQKAMDEVGSEMTPNVVWVKTKSHSVMLVPAKTDERESLADQIKEVFADIQPIAKIPEPKHEIATDYMTVYPIADAHIGMYAWAQECGEDYDSDIAVRYLEEGMGYLINASKPSETAIVINAGDFLHADDNTNATPRSKHALDVDGRHFRTVHYAIKISIKILEMAAQKHQKVIYRALRGNHDEHSHMHLTFALHYHFANNPRVEVEVNPMDFFVHEFGKVMICAHHGDKAKAERLVLHAADAWPDIWGRTRHRYYFTGHLHHTRVTDIGGMQHEQLRAATKKDQYAVSHSYTAHSQLQAITYHREKGESSRVVHNY